MAAYPTYADFGKSTKDFFTKGFQTDIYKLSIRDQMSKDINATITGTHNLEKKEASGDFQVKLTCPFIPGYISTTKWTTGNIISQEILAKEAFYPGLDVGIDGQFNADTSSIAGKWRSAFRHEKGTIETAVEGGDSTNNLVNGSLVSGYGDFAVGGDLQYDVTQQAFKKRNISASFVHGDIKFHSSLENADLVWAGLIYVPRPWLETGITVTYKADPDRYSVVGAALKYVMDCCTAVKVKFDSDMMFGLGFETKLRPKATITMSALIDGNKLNEGGHKIGLSFDFEN